MSTTPGSLHTALQAYPHARLKKYGVVAVVPEERASVLAVSSANPVAREVIVCVDGHFLRSWVPVDGEDQAKVARLVSTASRLRRGDALPVAAPRALIGSNVYDFHPGVPEVALTLDRVTPSRPTVLHLRLADGPRTKRPAEAKNNRGRLVTFPLHAVDRARAWAAAFAAAYPGGGPALVVDDQVEVPDVDLAREGDPRPAAEDAPDPGRAARVVHAWRDAAAALGLGGEFPGLSEAESGLSGLGLLGGADQGARVSPGDAAAGRLWLDDERPAPEGWTWVRSVNEAIRHIGFLEGRGIALTHASLDHDLGMYLLDGGEGARLVDYLGWHDKWPLEGFAVHSQNGHAAERMVRVAEDVRPRPWRRVPGTRTFGHGPGAGGGWPELPAPTR